MSSRVSVSIVILSVFKYKNKHTFTQRILTTSCYDHLPVLCQLLI